MPRFEMGVLAEYSTMFPTIPRQSIEYYLQSVPKATLLQLSSYLLRRIDEPENENYELFLRLWFSEGNEFTITYLLERCKRLEDDHEAKVGFLYAPAILQFFEWVYNKPSYFFNSDRIRVEHEVNILMAYLCFVEDEANKHTISEKFISHKPDTLRPAFALFNLNYSNSDLFNINLDHVIPCQIVKAVLLFEFLITTKKYGMLVESFLTFFDLESLRDFLSAILPITKSIMDSDKPGWITLKIADDDFKSKKFLENLNLSNFENEINQDFRFLRGKPIYNTAKNEYTIVYSLFAVEFLFKGLYFKFRELNDTLTLTDRIPNWRSDYTKSFSESFLLYRIADFMFRESASMFITGDDISNMNIDGGPDLYIRNQDDVFLFENKDILINGEIKQSNNLELIEAELIKKLYYEKDPTKNKLHKKAVLQLIENVRRILEKSNSFDLDYNEQTVSIFPLLVVHERQFDALGTNYIVNQWFNYELKKLTESNLNIINIQPLTIITIDTFILYADYFQAKPFRLKEHLNAFKAQTSMSWDSDSFTNKTKRTALGKILFPFSAFLDGDIPAGERFGNKKFEDIIFRSLSGTPDNRTR